MRDTIAMRPLPVRSQSVLPVDVIFRPPRKSTELPFPLDRDATLFTYSGTTAIYHGFRSLPLAAGATVLCPSYNCGHEIEPLLRLGLRVRCYRVGSDLCADLNDVERRIREGARAVMITHYFGFPQPVSELRALCDQYGCYLIEDCAHALLSNNSEGTLGRTGDATVYSMRKTLPLPNGGAVVFNNRALFCDEALSAPPLESTLTKALELASKASVDALHARPSLEATVASLCTVPLFGLTSAAAALAPRSGSRFYDPDDQDFAYDDRIMNWGMSKISRYILDRLELATVARDRRRNYRAILDTLKDTRKARPLLETLDKDVCPLYFPVRVDCPETCYRTLVRLNIHTSHFWREEHPAVDWEQYPEARALKRHVLILPVHQDIGPHALERMIAGLRAAEMI